MAESRPSLDSIFSAPAGPVVINMGKQPERPSLDAIFSEAPSNPMGEDATPAQVIRNAAMGRIDRTQAEDYLKSVGMDANSIDRFGDNASSFDTLAGLAQKPGQGAMFGTADEAVGAVTNPAAQEAMRRQLDMASKNYPVTSAGLEIGGNILGTLGLSRAFPKISGAIVNAASKGVIPSLATSAGVGAVSGGIYGAGEGEGGADARLKNAGDMGLFGGLGGVAGAAGAKVLGPLTRRALSIFSKSAPKAIPAGVRDMAESAAEKTAQEVPVEPASLGKVSKAVNQDVGELNPNIVTSLSKPGEALIDTNGAKVRQLAKGAAQYAGGQEVAENFFNRRVLKAPEKIKESIAQNIGGNDAYHATVDDILAVGREKAKPLYDEAYKANKSIVSKQIDKILETPAGKDALRQASVNMQNDMATMGGKDIGLTEQAKLAGTKADGGVIPGLNLRSLDYVKKALDDKISGAIRSGDKGVSRILIGLKNSLVDAMDAADVTAKAGQKSFKAEGGLYKQARVASGDYLKTTEAMENGKNFMSLDPELVAKQFKALPETEKTAYLSGVSKQLRDIVDKAPEGRNVYNQILGKPEQQKRLAAILSPEQYKNLASDLKAQDRLYKLRNEVLGGSPTTSKAVAAKEIETLSSDLQNIPSSSANFLGYVGKFIAKRFDGLNDSTARQVAQILFEERPERKLYLLEQMAGRKGTDMAQKKAAKAAYFAMDDAMKVFDKDTANKVVGAVVVGGHAGESKASSEETKYPPLRIDIGKRTQ